MAAIRAKNKEDFLRLCCNFKNPVLIHGLDDKVLVSHYWIVEDLDNIATNKVELPSCSLSNMEYDSEILDNYYKRENEKRKRYERWMDELFGKNGYKKRESNL